MIRIYICDIRMKKRVKERERENDMSCVKGLFIHTMTTTMIVCNQLQTYIKKKDFSGEEE